MPKMKCLGWLFLTLPMMNPTVTAQPEASVGWEPRVVFSDEQQRGCLVVVGDEFPQATLSRLSGGDFDLGTLDEAGLTLVAFWNYERIGGVQLCRKITEDVKGTGAELVTIFVGTDQETAQKIARDFGTHLIGGGELWKQVANGAPPRVFLLKGGQIVWMDIEYSLDTRREMLNAIRHFSQAAS